MVNNRNRLTIHIGLPKAATTSIQHTLFDNSALLQKHGVDYCKELCSIGANVKARGHHALSKFLCAPGSIHYKAIDEQKVRQAFGRPGELLISSEGFTRARRRDVKYIMDNWALPSDRRVIIVLRNELDRVRSQWTQAVKTGNWYLSFKDYYIQVYKPRRKSVEQRLKAWEEQGFDTVVLRYEELKAQDLDITRAFLSSIYDIDLPENEWTQRRDANVSPSPELVQSYQAIVNSRMFKDV